MKTRYKILIVIVVFVVFFFARSEFVQICLDISEENLNCKIWADLRKMTSPVISSNHMWDTDYGSGTWTSTEEIEKTPFPFMLKDNINAIVIYFVIPMIIILGIYYRDKKLIRNS